MAFEDEDLRMKCALVDDRVQPCAALQSTLGDPYGRGTRAQGLSVHSMINMETRKPSGSIVVIKSGEYGKTGIIANYCPICGEMINKHMLEIEAITP